MKIATIANERAAVCSGKVRMPPAPSRAISFSDGIGSDKARLPRLLWEACEERGLKLVQGIRPLRICNGGCGREC
jgi:hypothetical protein